MGIDIILKKILLRHLYAFSIVFVLSCSSLCIPRQTFWLSEARVKMSSSKLTKISKQHENTWAQLHRRLISLPFSYKDIFAENVYDYIDNQAVSRYMLQVSVRINFNQLKLISTSEI